MKEDWRGRVRWNVKDWVNYRKQEWVRSDQWATESERWRAPLWYPGQVRGDKYRDRNESFVLWRVRIT